MQPGLPTLIGISLVILVWLFVGMQQGPQSPYGEVVVIEDIRPSGADEVVTIKNHSQESVDLTGWKLFTKPIYEYRFPQGCILKSGQGVRVHSGPKASGYKACIPNSTALYQDLTWTRHYVWCNQNGDTALLYDGQGRRVDKYEYGAGWHRSLYVSCDRAGSCEETGCN